MCCRKAEICIYWGAGVTSALLRVQKKAPRSSFWKRAPRIRNRLSIEYVPSLEVLFFALSNSHINSVKNARRREERLIKERAKLKNDEPLLTTKTKLELWLAETLACDLYRTRSRQNLVSHSLFATEVDAAFFLRSFQHFQCARFCAGNVYYEILHEETLENATASQNWEVSRAMGGQSIPRVCLTRARRKRQLCLFRPSMLVFQGWRALFPLGRRRRE